MKNIVLGFVVLFFGFCPAVLSAGDAEVVRRQFIEYFVQTSSHESSVEKYLDRMSADGTWKDVDYESKRRGSWPTRDHLKRLQSMAVVYSDPDARLFQSVELEHAILRGLNHWIKEDYRNDNWWNPEIGVPQTLATTMLLLGEALPDKTLQQARPILARSSMGKTGQNKVWCAGIALMKGLLYEDEVLSRKAVGEIWSELRVSAEEGIQPDWSFHQHGPQQQFGNYGISFAGDMVKWASILRGTEHALSGDKLEILRNYMLNGVSWIIWNGRMDLSGCGRQNDEGCQSDKGRITQRQLQAMQAIDAEFSSEYEQVLQRVGFNAFWRSEMAVQRRPDWYASVKMSSTRVIGAETCNSENMQGRHLGDGTLLLYRDGSEYEDINPLWDWRRLPGTTCDQGMDELTPRGVSGEFGGSDFSSVIGDELTGIVAMIYRRDSLCARKATFMFDDHMVCLGSGISGATIGSVYTSVEQSHLKGEVSQFNEWIIHNGTAYQFISGQPEFSTDTIEGNWSRSFPTRGDRPGSGEVFSLWIDHGKSPVAENYMYRIFPEIPSGGVNLLRPSDSSRIIVNSEIVQAVEHDGKLYAVFYEAGELKSAGIRVSGPCLLIVSNETLLVADPTHSLRTLDVLLGSRRVTVELPQGAEQGRQVAVHGLLTDALGVFRQASGGSTPPAAVK